MTTKKRKAPAPSRQMPSEAIRNEAQCLYESESDLRRPGEVGPPGYWTQAILSYLDQLVELNPSLKRGYYDSPPSK